MSNFHYRNQREEKGDKSQLLAELRAIDQQLEEDKRKLQEHKKLEE